MVKYSCRSERYVTAVLGEALGVVRTCGSLFQFRLGQPSASSFRGPRISWYQTSLVRITYRLVHWLLTTSRCLFQKLTRVSFAISSRSGMRGTFQNVDECAFYDCLFSVSSVFREQVTVSGQIRSHFVNSWWSQIQEAVRL